MKPSIGIVLIAVVVLLIIMSLSLFIVDQRQIAVDRRGTAGLFSGTWHVGPAKRGAHLLSALATDEHGKRVSATRGVRVCG